MTRWQAAVCVIVGGVVAFFGAAAAAAAVAQTQLVSFDWTGYGRGNVDGAGVSDDGRLVLLVTGRRLALTDTDNAMDVYVRDRASGLATLASVGVDGTPITSDVTRAAISGDGRYVVFAALTTPRGVPRETVYRRDLATGTTVEVSPDGMQIGGLNPYPSVSADGDVIAYASNLSDLVPGQPLNAPSGVYVTDVDAGTTIRADLKPDGSLPDGSADWSDVALSADGQMLAFTSQATDLLAGQTVTAGHLYIEDLRDGSIDVADRTPSGTIGAGWAQEPQLSSDGSRVSFVYRGGDLVADDSNGSAPDVFVRDLSTGTTQLVDRDAAGAQDPNGASGEITADGHHVVLATLSPLIDSDHNGTTDIYLRDLDTGAVRRISVSDTGGEVAAHAGGGWSTADGSTVIFTATQPFSVDTYFSWAPDVYANGPAITPSRPAPTVTIDPPRLSAPDACGHFTITMPWQSSLAQSLGAIAAQSLHAGVWSDLPSASAPLSVTLAAGVAAGSQQSYRLQTIANDAAASAWRSWHVHFSELGAASTGLHWTGAWPTVASDFCNGKARRTRQRGASVALSFTGSVVRLYARRTSTRGRARISLDGQHAATIDEHGNEPRALVWSHHWTTAGRHTVVITNLATAGRPYLGVDRLVTFG